MPQTAVRRVTDVHTEAGFPTIRLGDRGPAVDDIRRRLRDVGYTPDEGSGVLSGSAFGEDEVALVESFQRDRHLMADGVVGPETWEALLEAGWRLGDRVLYDRRPWLRGDDVAELQSQLASLGFDVGKIDGIFGPLARRAVEEFQRNSGLRPDGIAGPATLRTMRRVSGAPAGKPDLAVRERLHVRTRGAGIAGKRVFLDPRPGSGDVELSKQSFLEQDFTYSVALTVAAILRGLGAHAMVSRGAEDTPIASDRASTANWFGADLIVTVGVSDTPDVIVRHFGTHTWESPAGSHLASHLGTAVAESLGTTVNESIRSTDPLLRETRAIAALVRVPVVEGDDEAMVDQIAAGLCRGLQAFLEAERDAEARSDPSNSG